MDRLWNCYREQQGMAAVVRAFEAGRVHHGYILSGVHGLGKRSVVLGLAVELLYPARTAKERSDLMYRLVQGAEADVLMLWDTGQSIKIEEIRELQRKLAQTATGHFRIVCIERIERMTTEAANAFLKTLEEPGERTIFLMTTDHYEELLPTIVSRAQVVTLSPLSMERLHAYVEEIAPGRWDEVQGLVFGRPEIARKLLADEEELRRYQEVYNAVQKIFGKGPLEEKVPIIEQVSAEKEDVLLFLELSSYYLRASMQEAVHAGRPVAPEVLAKISYLTKARQEIQQNVNKRLVLEHFLFLV